MCYDLNAMDSSSSSSHSSSSSYEDMFQRLNRYSGELPLPAVSVHHDHDEERGEDQSDDDDVIVLSPDESDTPNAIDSNETSYENMFQRLNGYKGELPLPVSVHHDEEERGEDQTDDDVVILSPEEYAIMDMPNTIDLDTPPMGSIDSNSFFDSDEFNVDSEKSKLEEIFRIHKESIYMEYEQKYSRRPDIEEFLRSFLFKYIEPCGWVGLHERHHWERNMWPVPIESGALLLPTLIDTKTLFVSCIELDKNNKDHWLGIGLDGIEIEDRQVYEVPLWEMKIVCAVEGVLINYKTFTEALAVYKDFRNKWSMPFQKSMLAEYWISNGCDIPMDLCYDLQNPGALSSKLRDEIIGLFCSIREKERYLSQLEHLQEISQVNDDDEDDSSVQEEDISEDDKMVYAQMELEKMSIRLSHIACQTTRSVIEKIEVEKHQYEIKDNELTLVIADCNANFSLLKEMKKVAAKWLNGDGRSGDNQVHLDDIKFKIVNSLNGAVKSCKKNSLILVGPGTYELTSLGFLLYGGSLIGVPFQQKSIDIITSGSGCVWLLGGYGRTENKANESKELNICDVNLIIKDSFEEKSLRTAFFFRSGGCLSMVNVNLSNIGGVNFGSKERMDGDEHYAAVGLEVGVDAVVRLNNCRINGFFTGIRAHSGSSVTCTECELTNCQYGFEMVNSKIEATVNKSKFRMVKHLLKTNGDQNMTSEMDAIVASARPDTEGNVYTIDFAKLPCSKIESQSSIESDDIPEQIPINTLTVT